MTKKNVRYVKTVKSEKRKSEEVSASKQIKELLIIILIVAIVFGLIYFLTVGANKLGWFDNHYNKPAVQEATISYETIQVGTILNRSESSYYVALYDSKNNSMYIETLIDSYKSKEGATKIYSVDLSEGLNRSIISDVAVTDVNNVSDLRINDTTLLYIRNGKIVQSYIGINEIETVLK